MFSYRRHSYIRRFRVFSISALGAGRQRGVARNPAERCGTLRIAKIRALQQESGNLARPARARRPPAVATLISGGFAYLVFPRWALMGRLPELYGKIRIAKIMELRQEYGNLVILARAYCSPFVATVVFGGFAYLSFARSVLGDNGASRGTPQNASGR